MAGQTVQKTENAGSAIEPVDEAKPAETPATVTSRSAAIKAQRDKLDPGPYVKYTGARDGLASLRVITGAEWKQVASDPKDAETGFGSNEWNVNNDFRIHEDEFTDGQLAYLYNVDDAFETVEISYDGETDKIIEKTVN